MGKRLPEWLLPRGRSHIYLVLMLIAFFSITSYATSVNVTSTVYQSQYGVSYDVTNAFSARDGGFSTVPLGLAASSQPCTWANLGVCRTALTVGDFQYQLTLTLNTPPGGTTVYTATVKWDQGAGQTQLGQLTVSVPNTATAGQSMTFQFDTSSSSFTTPLSMDVIVA